MSSLNTMGSYNIYHLKRIKRGTTYTITNHHVITNFCIMQTLPRPFSTMYVIINGQHFTC